MYTNTHTQHHKSSDASRGHQPTPRARAVPHDDTIYIVVICVRRCCAHLVYTSIPSVRKRDEQRKCVWVCVSNRSCATNRIQECSYSSKFTSSQRDGWCVRTKVGPKIMQTRTHKVARGKGKQHARMGGGGDRGMMMIAGGASGR